MPSYVERYKILICVMIWTNGVRPYPEGSLTHFLYRLSLGPINVKFYREQDALLCFCIHWLVFSHFFDSKIAPSIWRIYFLPASWRIFWGLRPSMLLMTALFTTHATVATACYCVRPYPEAHTQSIRYLLTTHTQSIRYLLVDRVATHDCCWWVPHSLPMLLSVLLATHSLPSHCLATACYFLLLLQLSCSY